MAQDQQGLHGGLFVSRAHALKYALFENGNKPHAVVMVPGVLELDMGRGRPALPIADNAPVPERRAA